MKQIQVVDLPRKDLVAENDIVIQWMDEEKMQHGGRYMVLLITYIMVNLMNNFFQKDRLKQWNKGKHVFNDNVMHYGRKEPRSPTVCLHKNATHVKLYFWRF